MARASASSAAGVTALGMVTVDPDHEGYTPADPQVRPTIVVIGEGYAPGDSLFAEDWAFVRDELYAVDPFGMFEIEPGRLAQYRCAFEERNPVGVGFAGGELQVEPQNVRSALEQIRDETLAMEEELGSLLEMVLQAPNQGFAMSLTPVLVVVLVKAPGSGSSGDTEHRLLDDCPYFVATHAVPGAGAVMAKALGRAFGLADEGTNPERLAVTDQRFGHPNAAYLIDAEATAEGTGHEDYPWRELLPLAVSQVGAATPGLHRGALGQATNMYRFAPHCLMRMPIGVAPGARDSADTVAFCAACRQCLEGLILTPLATPARARTIDRQATAYDDAQFTERVDLPRTDGQVRTTTSQGQESWWQYTVDAGAPGLALSNVHAQVPGMHGGTTERQPVFASIEFRELRATLKDRGELPIDLGAALTSTLERGTVAVGDPLMQEGVRYTAVVPVGASTSAPALVEIELAVTFRWPNNDSDPPGAITALKIFPQIAFRQVGKEAVPDAPGDFPGVVERFHGEVCLDSDITTPQGVTDHMKMLMEETYGTVPPGNRNYVSFFTETPNQFLWHTDLVSQLAWRPEYQSTAWMSIFDYATLDFTAPKEVLAVPGPRDSRWNPPRRKDRYDWPGAPPNARAARAIWKEPRQGDQDNVHVHGSMGTVYHHASGQDTGRPRIMAPGCGHSCLHLHWRWGITPYHASATAPAGWWGDMLVDQIVAWILDAIALTGAEDPDAAELTNELLLAFLRAAGLNYPMRATIMGWSADPGERSRGQVKAGAPMIPPNQTLVVGIRDPAGGSSLPTDRKLVVYAVDVDTVEEYDAHWKHVTFEHGASLATAYHPSTTGILFHFIMFAETGELAYLPAGFLRALAAVFSFPAPDLAEIFAAVQPYDIQRVMTQVYDVIRFIDREQVPMTEALVPGATVTHGGKTMESL
jgi:hypothetical protein